MMAPHVTFKQNMKLQKNSRLTSARRHRGLELPDELGHDTLARGRMREHACLMRMSMVDHLVAAPPTNGQRRASSGEPERWSDHFNGARVIGKGRGADEYLPRSSISQQCRGGDSKANGSPTAEESAMR
jgi:hypothetical protein